MRILLDENIHPQVVALLRDAGHDVLSITETDKGASDPVVFQTAVSDERVWKARHRKRQRPRLG